MGKTEDESLGGEVILGGKKKQQQLSIHLKRVKNKNEISRIEGGSWGNFFLFSWWSREQSHWECVCWFMLGKFFCGSPEKFLLSTLPSSPDALIYLLMPPTYFQLPIYFSSSSFYHFTPQPLTKSWWSPDTQIQQLFISPHSIQFSSLVQLCLTLCDPMYYSTPDFPVHHQLPELAQIHVHWVSDAIQPSHPLLSPSLPPSIFPSIRVFSNESVLWIRWP